MRTHEYYEELCALLPIGQLSAAEYQELDEHLRGCQTCRNATGDFSVILDKMPVSETDLDEKTLTALQGSSYRERFLKRAVREGVPFTNAVFQDRSRFPKWSLPHLRLVPSFAAAAVLIIAVLSVQLFRMSKKLSGTVEHPAVQQVQVSGGTEGNQNSEPLRQMEAKVAALEAQAAQQQVVISELKSKLNESHSAFDSTKSDLSRATDQIAQAQKDATETHRALLSAKADLERARSDREHLDATLVEQQIKINDLASQVKEKEGLAERERQLSSVAKDVRELMGARNLHILDVSDVDGNGRSKKSFGRVFLVEGKSLIFYAFDLGDRGNPAKVSFQAWGQLEGRQTIAKNLGVFYVDDHAQKRWVLKVNDPTKLRAINSVFVTVEPLGGVDRPTGKKLLYAYFGTQANHP